MIRKVAEDAFVLEDGVVGAAKFPIAFAQAEHRRSRDLPVLIELLGERFVAGDRRIQIAICLLLEQPALKQRCQVVRHRHGHAGCEHP
ncbi:MAG TPA: hypothetical protein VK327_08380 [Candidatus Paceibacterota bacterium]|nr:hypothetical protein [Candidatus Paceibacterota bacterium]